MSDKILDRVRKLLAIANDERANEGERDNALRMAHNLLAKYQLDMSDVDAREREKQDPRGHFQNDGWNMLWCKDVRNAIAKLFDTTYYFGRKINATRGEHHFVGRESNATTAMLLSDWIIRSILREADQRYKHRLTPEGRSFAMGVAYKLYERVDQLKAAKQQEFKEAGYSIVLADASRVELEENGKYISKVLGRNLTVRNRKRTSVNADAFSSGEEYGSSINLNTQLTKNEDKKALK